MPLVVIDIDDRSLAEIGQWPWPRSIFAELLVELREVRPLVITFDVLFAENDRFSPPTFARAIETTAPALAAELRRMDDNDRLMAEAMAGQNVVLGVAASYRRSDDVGQLDRGSRVAMLGRDPGEYIPTFKGLIGVADPLDRTAGGFGAVTLTPDVDGIVRRVPLLVRAGGVIIPSLSLETLRLALGESTVVVRASEAGIESVVLRGVGIPTDGRGRIWVRYSEPEPHRYISAVDLLTGAVPKSRLDGHVVFIGSSAAGLGDIKSAPIAQSIAGVEIHAQVLQTLMTGSYLARPWQIAWLERSALLIIGLLMAWFGPLMRARYYPVVLGLLTVIGIGVMWYAFRYHGLLIDASYGAASLAILLFWLAMARYVREEARRRTIRNAFSLYLPPEMVDRLSTSADELRLGGERRDLTILFSDIRGFTGLSERYEHDPEGLTTLLNRYFTEMTSAIQDNQGTIDKYIGDAIMAFWNAPLAVDDHARRACLAALQMRDRLHSFNDTLKTEAEREGHGFVPIRIGIGLNTGNCFIGNLGSDQRFNYSVIGDPVNIAARLEARSKYYDTEIVIGEATRDEASDLALLEVDHVRLVGKSRASAVFALIGDAEVARSRSFDNLRTLHSRMIEAYRSRQWDLASETLEQVRPLLEWFGLSRIAEIYGERITRHRDVELPEDWQGEEIAMTKS